MAEKLDIPRGKKIRYDCNTLTSQKFQNATNASTTSIAGLSRAPYPHRDPLDPLAIQAPSGQRGCVRSTALILIPPEAGFSSEIIPFPFDSPSAALTPHRPRPAGPGPDRSAGPSRCPARHAAPSDPTAAPRARGAAPDTAGPRRRARAVTRRRPRDEGQPRGSLAAREPPSALAARALPHKKGGPAAEPRAGCPGPVPARCARQQRQRPTAPEEHGRATRRPPPQPPFPLRALHPPSPLTFSLAATDVCPRRRHGPAAMGNRTPRAPLRCRRAAAVPPPFR